ncbi:hypothetical protein [Alteromonas ponticola]|uniref:PEP-CTERM sorting domain-containing protein n=1 Tax=Alteromonas ponticola TaxID=2720613 RepID=A0ABX1R361_9ALTE|nr:hypothetical protein [Alteromonas ponticola]NMH59512.1 hypothetical protein [Alteromonas ponticola]
MKNKSEKLIKHKLLSLLIFYAALVSGSAHANVIYSTGFESPAFSVGDIEGQQGWQVYGDETGEAVIQNAESSSGTQALELDMAGTLEDDYFETYLPVGIELDGGIFTLTADFMRVGTVPDYAGISLWGDTGFLGQILALNDNALGSSSGVQLGNNDTNGEVLTFTESVWHTFSLELDFDAMLLSGWVDGNSLGQLAINPSAGAPTVIEDIVLFSFSSDEDQSVFFDNITATYSESDSQISVPEPQTFAIVMLGMICLLSRQRQQV